MVANEGTVLTIDGDGTVIGGSGSTSASKINNAIRVRNGGKCIINSGTFTTGADGNGNPNSVIYVRRTTSRQPGAEVVINGGFFYNDTCDANGNNWLLNIEDDDIDVCKITVYGGTFVNFNPADTNTEKEGKDNFVAEGYHVEQKKQENGDIWYTVFPDAAGE